MVAERISPSLLALPGDEPQFLRIIKAEPRAGDEVVCLSECGRLLVVAWSEEIAPAVIVGVVRGRIVEG